jgi:hypothetical protein
MDAPVDVKQFITFVIIPNIQTSLHLTAIPLFCFFDGGLTGY